MKNWNNKLGDALSLGFEMCLATMLGALLGYYLDGKFNSFPVGVTVGLFLGTAAGFYRVIKKFLLKD